MASWLSRTAQFWNEWGLRIAVLSSLAAHVALVLVARTRRHSVSLWGWLLLWPAYQVADTAATYALGNLSLGGTGSSASASSSSSCEQEQKQQLVAFWAPFLLLHLGRPDNISAYALEDNTLSLRQALEVALQVAGASYVLYNNIYLGHSGDLLPASAIMFAAGVTKYVERAVALRRGNLENIRDNSRKKKKQQQQQPTGKHVVRRTTMGSAWRDLDNNEQALRFAHDMFPFCQRAMVDSSVELVAATDDDSPDVSAEQIFSLRWSSMCTVVEMELSLMYDVLYTKASVIHTWGGYLIRLISPFATAAAASLFWFYLANKDCLVPADVVITYMLLAVAFFLDVVWLVRALGSTWTYAFLSDRPRVVWLYHSLLCSGRWRRFRRIFVSLDPSSWLLGQDPTRYRMWSGNIGRYNLLHECTRTRGAMGRLCGWMVFQRIQRRLPSSSNSSKDAGDAYTMKDITTAWGQKAVEKGPEIFTSKDEQPFFGREFQEDILVWHIGTCILLAHATEEHVRGAYGKAIEVLSEYLMFLAAVRRHMLPGLVLRSLFEKTHEAMLHVWAAEAGGKKKKNNSSRFGSRRMDIVLAKILYDLKFRNEDWGLDNPNIRLISDGIDLATVLLQVEETDMPKLMELVFDVWIDKLLYAGTLCSRESHAKQLSRGGELTSIVWITTEHAGPFRIGETVKETKRGPPPPKKEKPKKEEPAPPAPTEPPPPRPLPPPMMYPTPPPPKEEARKRRRRVKYATLYPPY